MGDVLTFSQHYINTLNLDLVNVVQTKIGYTIFFH